MDLNWFQLLITGLLLASLLSGVASVILLLVKWRLERNGVAIQKKTLDTQIDMLEATRDLLKATVAVQKETSWRTGRAVTAAEELRQEIKETKQDVKEVKQAVATADASAQARSEESKHSMPAIDAIQQQSPGID